MADISRVRVTWSNWSGGPGVSTFYLSGTDYAALAPLHTFFEAVKAYIPSPIVITVPSQGDIIDDGTGVLTGQWQHGSDATTTGTATGAYAAASGALIRWNTAKIHRGRMMRGHTFLVPIQGTSFASDGGLLSGAAAAIQTAANNLVSSSSGELVIWGRPKVDPGTGVPAGGTTGSVTTATVPLKGAVLRTRRD